MSDERRMHSRVEWISPGTIDLSDGRPGRPCILNNLSNGGAKLSEVQDAATLPDEFILRLSPSRGPARKCRVIWRSSRGLGVEFTEVFQNAGKPQRRRREAQVPAV